MLHQGHLDRGMLTTLDGSMFIPKVINLITLGWKHATILNGIDPFLEKKSPARTNLSAFAPLQKGGAVYPGALRAIYNRVDRRGIEDVNCKIPLNCKPSCQ